MSVRVCVIGAGPSGMAVLHWLEKKRSAGQATPEVVCYEKQSNWGGLWNYTWRTGTDQHGEPVHGSMYRFLWSNGPKECLELPDYTFEEHFGRPIPSFPPRQVLFDYLQGRWKKHNLEKYIKFNCSVRDVAYQPDTHNFSVIVKDLTTDQVLEAEQFDYVIVASGHYSVPNVPEFPGIDRFEGRVLHAHDFREPREFAGKRLLLIGSSYSAEDLALQTVKYGAQSVICTWKSRPMGFRWPKQVSERPLVQRFEGKKAIFKDGSEAEVDAVIMCTGYLHSYPFLREELRLKTRNVLYPPNLYRGVVWTKAADNRLLYCGAQDQYYTFTMFDACGLYAVKLLLGEILLPDQQNMINDAMEWEQRSQNLADCHQEIQFQTDYVLDLIRECGPEYPYDIDVSEMFHEWEGHKVEDITTYRDKSFASKFTGNLSPVHHTTFMTAMDDSMETFLATRHINGIHK